MLRSRFVYPWNGPPGIDKPVAMASAHDLCDFGPDELFFVLKTNPPCSEFKADLSLAVRNQASAEAMFKNNREHFKRHKRNVNIQTKHRYRDATFALEPKCHSLQKKQRTIITGATSTTIAVTVSKTSFDPNRQTAHTCDSTQTDCIHGYANGQSMRGRPVSVTAGGHCPSCSRPRPENQERSFRIDLTVPMTVDGLGKPLNEPIQSVCVHNDMKDWSLVYCCIYADKGDENFQKLYALYNLRYDRILTQSADPCLIGAVTLSPETFLLKDLGHQSLMRIACMRMRTDRNQLVQDIRSQAKISACANSRSQKIPAGFQQFTIYVLYSCFQDISAFIHFLMCSKNCPMCNTGFWADGSSMLKLGSTKHNVTKRYCEFLALMIAEGAVDFGKEVKLYGGRQMQFNVEAYILIRMLKVLEVKSVEFHTEMFRSDEYAVVVRAAHGAIMLELKALGVV